MQTRPSKAGIFSIFLSCCLTAFPAQGLETDGEQAVEYTADGDLRMHNEGNSRLVVINENVRVTQGTIEIIGDTATFEYDLTTSDLILMKVTVNGSPAHYQQQINAAGDLVEGESETIDYYVDVNSIVEFVGNAKFSQPGTTTNCVAIKYFIESELLETTGPCSGVLSNQTN